MGSKRFGRRPLGIVIAVVLIGATGWLSVRAEQPKGEAQSPKITVGKDTTYITQPLSADGTPNYVAAVNERYGRGVTPENNAAVALLRIVGPDVIDPDFQNEEVSNRLRKKILQEMGYTSPKPGSPKFSDIYDYGDKHFVQSYEKYQKLRDVVSKPAQKLLDPNQHPELVGWLKANQKALDAVCTAVQRPRYFIPLVSKSDPPRLYTTLFYDSGFTFRLARALVARANLSIAVGDPNAACRDLLAVHRLARLINHGPFFISQLTGMFLDSFAVSGDRLLLADGRLTSRQAEAYLALLDALPPFTSPVDTVDWGDRILALDCVCMTARDGYEWLFEQADILRTLDDPNAKPVKKQPLPDVEIDWNLVLRIQNRLCDRMAVAYRIGSYTKRQKALDAIDQDIMRHVPPYVDKKFVAYAPDREELRRLFLEKISTEKRSETLAYILAAGDIPFDKLETRGRDRFDLIRVGLALAAFKADNGRYPDKLAALTPKYLKDVPKDRFSGKSLIYRPEAKGYLLYSVGPNLKDEDGLESKEGVDFGDVVLRIP